MSNPKTYLPSAWMDETIPEMFENVDQFIIVQPDGSFRISYEDPSEAKTYSIELNDGDIVAFDCQEIVGVFTVQTDENSQPIMPPDYPAWANQHLEDDDWEHQSDSLEDLFECSSGIFGKTYDPNSAVDVRVNDWRQQHFKFIANPKPHFEKVTAQ